MATEREIKNLVIPLALLLALSVPAIILVLIYTLSAEAAPKTVIYHHSGGDVVSIQDRWLKLAREWHHIEIRGRCASACTLILGDFLDERVCFSEAGHLAFHQARDPKGKPSYVLSQWMFAGYPKPIRAWIMKQGGLPETGFIELKAPELWQMGYRKCD